MLGTGKALALMLGLLMTGAYGAGVVVVGEPASEPAGASDEPLMACEQGTECNFVAIGLMVRWGFLGPHDDKGDREEPQGDGAGEGPADHDAPMVPWDGFLEVTRGGVKLVRTLLFERGGEYRFGGDDLIYPRNNQFTLEWRSSTTVHWDGILAVVVVPKMDDPMPHVTLHTDQWSRVFRAPQLIGLHARIPTDDLGHEIEINGFRVEMDRDMGEIAILKVMVRWGYLEQPEDDESAIDDPQVPENHGDDDGEYAMVPWDGFLSTTKGGVKLVRPLLFESGGDYDHGGDDLVYPRNNRFTLEWRSSTTTHWDGVLVAIAVPVRAIPEAHITLHTDQWSHVFEARQLVGLHVRIPTDDLGHEIEINGMFAGWKDSGDGAALSLEAEVLAANDDHRANDVLFTARMGDAPLPGVEIYVNDELAGVANDDGNLLVEDLGVGEYSATTTMDDLIATAEFEVGE
jgi:hypothetical protein